MGDDIRFVDKLIYHLFSSLSFYVTNMSDQTWRNAINNNPIHQSIRQFLNQFPLKTHRSLYRPRELDYPRLYIWGPGWKLDQRTSFDQECAKWQVII